MATADGLARTNRVVVRLHGLGDAAAVRRRADDLVADVPGVQLVRVSPNGRVLLAIPHGMDPKAVAAVLDRRPDVAYAEADIVDKAQPAPPGLHN